MRVSQFRRHYTDKGRGVFFFSDVLGEFKEFLVEVIKLNEEGIREELIDTVLFFQLWLYCRWGFNPELWRLSQQAIPKFEQRRKTWSLIYAHVGLPRHADHYCGNYAKPEKVVRHLRKFHIPQRKALEAYETIVKGGENPHVV